MLVTGSIPIVYQPLLENRIQTKPMVVNFLRDQSELREFFGDKKIVVFAGRIHHFSRLLPIVSALGECGADVSWVAADNMINNDPSTEYLIPARARFLHVLDFLESKDKNSVVNMTQKIMADNRAEFQDAMKWVSPFSLAFSVREMSECAVGFTNLIEKVAPSFCLVLHENNFWAKLLAHIAHTHKVPVIGFQEGVLRRRDQETMKKQAIAGEYTDRLFVWSEDARDQYIAAGLREDVVVPVGMWHFDQVFLAKTTSEFSTAKRAWRSQYGLSDTSKVITFALPQLNRYEGDFQKAIDFMVTACTKNNQSLFLRFHPFESSDTVDFIARELRGKAQVDRNVGLPLSVMFADLVVSQHSTIALEAVALGVPVVHLDLSLTGVLEPLGPVVNDKECLDLMEALAKRNKLPPLPDNYSFLVGNQDGYATHRILSVLSYCE